MALPHGIPLLVRRLQRLCALALWALLPGCGLVFDAVQHLYPITANELDRVCQRRQIQVGMAAEPFLPFVFPAVWTDEGARVTGLDTEIVRNLTDALSAHCGTTVTPTLHLVRFRDLFLLLNEGQLDFFVSAVAIGSPTPERSGFAYSSPYFSHGGLGGITNRPEVVNLIRSRLQQQTSATERGALLDGLTIAVQGSTAAHFYVQANAPTARLLVCDSLPAAFEHAASGAAPPIDIIVGAHPVLEFLVKTTRRDWLLLAKDGNRPLQFIHSQYAVVTAEESYSLRWFINRVIFDLDESGRLQHIRHRWLDESYAYPRRASAEGLSFDVRNMPAHYAQGTCRATIAPPTH